MPNTDSKLSGLPLGLEYELILSADSEPSITRHGAELLRNLIAASTPSLDQTAGQRVDARTLRSGFIGGRHDADSRFEGQHIRTIDGPAPHPSRR